MNSTLRRRQILWAYRFLSVSLIFFIVIRWYPTLLAFNISFRDWNIFQGDGPWVGSGELSADLDGHLLSRAARVRAAFINTLQYVIFGVPLQIGARPPDCHAAQQHRALGRFLPRRLLRSVCHLAGRRCLCLELALCTAGRADQPDAEWLGLPMQPFTKARHRRCRR